MFVPSTRGRALDERQQPDDRPADRRLARPGLADEADDLAVADRQRHAVDGAERRRAAALGVLDGDVAQVDDQRRRLAGVGDGVDRSCTDDRPPSRRRPRRTTIAPRCGTGAQQLLRVRVAAGALNTWSAVPDSTIRPRCITMHPVGQVGDDAHVVGDQQDAGVDAVARGRASA